MTMIYRVWNIWLWLWNLSHQSKKNVFFLLWDYVRLNRKQKVSRLEYTNYEMYKCSTNFRDTFLSYARAEDYWKILNPSKFACLARDKYLSHCLFYDAQIPSAHLYIYYNPEISESTDMFAYNYETMVYLLKKKGFKSFVVKPASESAHGEGVFVCKDILFGDYDCWLVKQNDQRISLRSLLGTAPLLFEERIEQTNQLSAFNSSSINTIRIMTALYPDGEVKLVAAFIKIGRKGSDVDNAGNGGNIDCAVDLKTGMLYNAVEFNSWNDVRPIEKHPDSDQPLNGVYLENWDKIVSCVKNFQAKVPFLKTIGWDVALTGNGPVIIEINNWWDTTGQLFIQRGWKYQIEDCYFQWKSFYEKKTNG